MNLFFHAPRLVPTDVPNPIEPGEVLYLECTPARSWFEPLYRSWMMLSLFAGIVGRSAWGGGRIGPVTAWSVARGVWR